jgi:hypothetical protein
LLIFMINAACRASRQTIGNPASVRACHNQVVSVQADAHGACLRIVASIAVG